MAQKLLKAGERRKVAAKRPVKKTEDGSVVLVGTYHENQLDWIKKNGVYNYPVEDDAGRAVSTKPPCDDGRAGCPRPAVFAKVKELWLYAGAKAKRHCFAAEFVGIQSKAEFLAANPTYAKKVGKPSHAQYAVFKTKPLDYGPKLEGKIVVARAVDFAKGRGQTKKIAAAIKQFHADGEFAPLAAYLPKELGKVPRPQLRVCEAAVQLDFMDVIFPRMLRTDVFPEQVKDTNLSIIDLFAGCGGMSLGFELAGFHPVLAIEKDAWAAETYAYNRSGVNVVTGDIMKIKHPKEQYSGVDGVFGIIGGPPCQGFSLSGDRDPKDPRNSLFMDYMRFVEDFRPSFFVMENVPGILSSVTKAGEPVKDVILSVAEGLGYNVKIMQLDASHYGVPQSRQRVFFVGIRNDYPFDSTKLTPVKTTEKNPITVRQALSDLPRINACEGEDSMPYGTPPDNDYQIWCRNGSDVVENHVAMRHTKRLIARFHVIQCGESAADVPKEHMQRKRGNAAVISGKVYSQNNMRPFPDRPSPTIPASFQSNFVHPFFDRNYTAREGARLQSFPDTYIFKGRRTTMSWEKNLSQYQQIGNAVPPLLAKALGLMVKNYFKLNTAK